MNISTVEVSLSRILQGQDSLNLDLHFTCSALLLQTIFLFCQTVEDVAGGVNAYFRKPTGQKPEVRAAPSC